MDSLELTAMASSIALTICKCFPKDQLLLLGSLISVVGETVTRVSLQNDMIEDICSKTGEVKIRSQVAADFILEDTFGNIGNL